MPEIPAIPDKPDMRESQGIRNALNMRPLRKQIDPCIVQHGQRHKVRRDGRFTRSKSKII